MIDRYQRHSLIDWFSQEKIHATKVAVIGAGAVGNEVAKNLALLGVGRIRIFDFDLIEEHNLTRSVLFRPENVGESKAEAAARAISRLDPNVSAEGIHGDFWHTITFDTLRDSTVVFCCVDNFEARIRCNTLCNLLGVDLINVGIDSRYASVEVFPFASQPHAACFECHLPSSVYQRISSRYSCGHLRKVSLAEQRVPTTIVTSSIASALAVSKGLRMGGDGQAAGSEKLFVDTIAGVSSATSLDRAIGCPGCGRFDRLAECYRVSRNIVDWPTLSLMDVEVFCSEPILVSYRIGSRSELILEPASKFDSEYPKSLSQSGDDVELEIRDQFTLGEIVQRFSGRPMPGKYAIVRSGDRVVGFEFKEDDE